MWYNGFLLLDMTKCKTSKKLAQMQNNHLFIQVFMRLFESAMMRYKLEGLPDTVNERVVLQSLICYGSVVFFENNGSILALPSVPSGDGYNINGDPVKAWVFSRNGIFNKQIPLYIEGGENEPLLDKGASGLKRDNPYGYMLWETKTRYPFINTIFYYARAISDTMRTLDVAKIWLKMPNLPVCEESMVESVKHVFQSIKNNEEIIPVSGGLIGLDKFNLLPIGNAVQNVDACTELIDWYEMKFREACGMKANTAADKKGENLITDEVHINDSYTDSITDTLADYLNEQLEAMNNFLGTSIRAVVNENLQEDTQDDNMEDERTGANDDE